MSPPEPSFADERAAAVAEFVCRAIRDELGDSLQTFIVHGSAITGYIPHFSDFDVVLLVSHRITIDEAGAIQAKLSPAAIDPFAYLQISRVVLADEPEARLVGLIDGAFCVVHGQLPEAWSRHSIEALRERGDEAIERAGREINRLLVDWAVATGVRRAQLLRFLATVLKPALRGRLVVLGEPVSEVWRASYRDLADRWRQHNPTASRKLERWLRTLPPDELRVGEAGTTAFELLREVADS